MADFWRPLQQKRAWQTTTVYRYRIHHLKFNLKGEAKKLVQHQGRKWLFLLEHNYVLYISLLTSNSHIYWLRRCYSITVEISFVTSFIKHFGAGSKCQQRLPVYYIIPHSIIEATLKQQKSLTKIYLYNIKFRIELGTSLKTRDTWVVPMLID